MAGVGTPAPGPQVHAVTGSARYAARMTQERENDLVVLTAVVVGSLALLPLWLLGPEAVLAVVVIGLASFGALSFVPWVARPRSTRAWRIAGAGVIVFGWALVGAPFALLRMVAS